MNFYVNNIELFKDPMLTPYIPAIERRHERFIETEKRLTQSKFSLKEFANAHEYFGLHKAECGWIVREWAPNASQIFMIGDFSNWKELPEYELKKINVQTGVWELYLSADKLKHEQLYKFMIKWDGGCGERIPAYVRRVVQDGRTKQFAAQVWEPQNKYIWKLPDFSLKLDAPLVYESHVGMASEEEKVGSYLEFKDKIIPRIKSLGYNTVQLMAVMEHPYYGSFGYHVSSFFAASSRFGTPEELKELVDYAHGEGLAVIMDIVHSHSVKNDNEGLSRFDGTVYQYFHGGSRGEHIAWDSRCFDYGKTEVLHFLLSNCRFWLDEYKIDGFRFDGITSMMFHDHGLGTDFGNYEHYFDNSVDENAVTYLALANKVIHQVNPNAITIAEDVSGMPGLGAPIDMYGVGFDYRLSLGIPDFWFKHMKKVSDDFWNVDNMFYELVNHRKEEKTINYVECHDQAIVGSKTMAFELMDAGMYTSMDALNADMAIARGMALHKMIRLATISTACGGYLNFMGNEFGHPEWIDFPREGNNWSYKYARRQWNLVDNPFLKYKFLNNFDKAMINLVVGHGVINSPVHHLYSHCDDKILAYERHFVIFIFNFHPTKSFTDYFLPLTENKYELLFSTDDEVFGGHCRIKPEQIFESSMHKQGRGILIYLPSRSAIVLKVKF